MTPPYLPAGPAHDADPAHPIASYRFFFSIFCNRFFERIFHEICLPSGTPKSPKIAPGAEKVRSETAPDAIFVDFRCRCCSESLLRSFLDQKTAKKTIIFVAVFCWCAFFSLIRRTLKIVVFPKENVCFQGFAFFRCCVFLAKRVAKIMLKTDRGKGSQKSHSGTLLGAILGPKID